MQRPSGDSTNPAVEVSGLTRRFRRVLAVNDVNLTIPSGGVYGLLGPNGSGKTTLLSMLAGFLTPTAGDIKLLGQSGTAGLGQARSRVGAMIERPIFWPYMSCRDNLKCLHGLYGCGDDEDEIQRLLELVNLDGDAARRKFGACSTGMKQRLAIAATLIGNPSLLILDEPTNGLDPTGIVEVRELIRDLAGPGESRTVILASHLLNEVEQVCDQVGVMARGRLMYSGRVADMLGQSLVRIRTTDDAQAAESLAAGGWSVERDGSDGLDVGTSPGSEWEVSRALAEDGIYIHEMRSLGSSLEAGFLEVTAGQAEQS